jgi:hypothetical protein
MKTLFTIVSLSVALASAWAGEETSQAKPASTPVAPAIFSRSFKIDTNWFYTNLKGSIYPIAKTKDAEHNHNLLRDYLKNHDADVGPPPCSLFISQDTLLFHTTRGTMDRIETLIAKLNSHP